MSKRERLQVGEAQDSAKAPPWWLDLCLVIGGVGCDWYSAFAWFSGRYSYCAEPVLRGMALTVVFCACIAVFVVCVGRAKPREAMQVFFTVSWGLSGFMFIGRVGGWPGQPR